MEVEYRWYEGDLESVEKNRVQLTDDEAIKSKIPEHLRNSSRWGECDSLDRVAQDRLIIEFITAFERHYGGHFDTLNKEKIKVCMGASAGKPWKQYGILKKKDFYQHRNHEEWLCQYIHYAHCFNWRENFSAAPKGELTEKEDISNKKSRVFYVAGVMNDYYASDLCKDFNAAIKRMAWNSVGEVWQYGGFIRFGEEMDKVVSSAPEMVIEESDCSKYDLTAIPFFFRLIIMMRLYFAQGHGYENLRLRLEQLYHQALEKDLIWFDGTVFKTRRGNPSGWKNTTEDNCIRHLFIRWFHFTKTMKQDPDYFWTKVFLRVYSDDSVCIADRRLLGEEDLNASYTYWKTVYKGYVKPLTRDVTDTTYLGARFKKDARGITYTIARNKAFWSMCVQNRKLTPLEIRNRCETIAALVANDEEVLEEFLRFIEPYGIHVNVEKSRFIAGGLLGTCTDFSHVGFSSECVNFCREAPSSGFKEVTTGPVKATTYTQQPLSSNLVCKMTAGEKKAMKKAAVNAARKAAKEELKKKEITATRNASARAVIQKAIVSKRQSRINWYLLELLDPSRWEEALAHGVRGIPDFYSHRGHIFCTRTVMDLGPTNFDSSGKCNVLVRPSLNQHVVRSVPTAVKATYEYGFAVNNGGDGMYWFNEKETNDSVPSQSYAVGVGAGFIAYPKSALSCASTFGGSGQTCNKLWPVGAATEVYGEHGNYVYGITPAADNVARMNLLLKQPLPAGVTGNITLETVTDIGTTVTNQAAVAAHSTALIQHTMEASATRINRIRLVNNTSAVLNLSNIAFGIIVTRNTDYRAMVADDCQNFSRISADFSAYRPVCGYLWLKYRGDLTKSGNIAGALIDSAATPTIAGVSDYDSLAGLLHSYEGNVTQGGYGVWAPMNPNDTNFTRPEDLRERAPFLMAAMDINDVAAQSVRVEVYFVWEALTQLQMYAPEPGTVDIEMMDDAFAKLAHFNKFMENDTHLRSIAAFLSGAMRKGTKVYGDLMANPLGKQAVASAARLLLSKAQHYGPAVANAAKIALTAASAL